MELRQLAYLVAVVDEGSFTRAAERLHVAQPGVSAQIRRLEAELRVQLLDRRPDGVVPAPAGQAVLAHARAALAGADGVRVTVQALRGLLSGRAALGVVTSTQVDLPELLAAFHAEHPGVDLELREGSSDVLLAGLLDGTLDVAVAGLGADDVPAGLQAAVLVDEALVAVVAHDHELARRRRLTVSELARHPLISLPRGTGLRSLLEQGCARAGVRAHVAFEAGDPTALVTLAARKLGIALVPASLGAAHGHDVRALPVVDPELRGRLALCWRTGGPTAPAGQALLTRAQAAWVDGRKTTP